MHTHSSKAGVIGRTAAHLERVPLVIHSIHGWGFTPLQSAVKRALFVAVERRVGRWTDHFIAVSHANRRQGEELGVLDPDRVPSFDLESISPDSGTCRSGRTSAVQSACRPMFRS